MRKVIRNTLALTLAGIVAIVAIVLAPAAMAATGKITGKVTWSGALPVYKYVDVYEWDADRQYWDSTSFYSSVNDTGVYTIENVDPGTYTVRASGADYTDTWLGNTVFEPFTYGAVVTFQVKDGQVTSGINVHLSEYWPKITTNLTNFTPSANVSVDFYSLTKARRYSASATATAAGTVSIVRNVPPGQYWMVAASTVSPDEPVTVRRFAQRGVFTVGTTAQTISLTGANAQRRLSSPWPAVTGSTQVGQTIEAHVVPDFLGAGPALSPTVKYFWTDGRKIISTTNKATIPASVLGTSFPGFTAIIEAPGQVSRLTYGDITEFSMIAQPGSPAFPSTIPGIKGKPKVGAKLKARTGKWSPTPTSFAFQWLRNGRVISGATKGTYRLAAADAGKRISVRVAGVLPGHAASAIVTARTAKVKKAKTKVTIKAAKKSLKKGSRAKITVRVKAPGAKPTGRVIVKIGGKSVKAKVKKGRAVVRSPKLTSSGSLTISAQYTGTKAFTKSKMSTRVSVR